METDNNNAMTGETPSTLRTSSEGSLEASRLLRRELNEATVKHQEEVYWLRLELDTTRREKEAVEDRMAEVYRDMQEMLDARQHTKAEIPPSSSRPLVLDADYVKGLQGQLEKYERMLRIMNNQISLVRSSSDSVVQNLKEEISDLMDEKCKVERELMNKLADLEKEKRQLEARLETEKQHRSAQHRNGTDTPEAAITPSGDDSRKQLQTQLEKLEKRNDELFRTLEKGKSNARENHARWKLERATLLNQVDTTRKELVVLRSSTEAAQRLGRMDQDREETIQTLERVSLLWDRADESIHNLESVIMELRPRNDYMDENQEQLLSTLETASLVHGQVKVSLMLVELKLRNNLACLKNDTIHLGAMEFAESSMEDKITEIHEDALAAIHQIESALDKQMQKLDQQSEEETKVVRETLQSKVRELTLMQSRQTELQAEISKLQSEENGAPTPQKGGNDLFVSRKVMERLQDEVLQVVERVKEKNEIIGRLTANVEEHKVRERTLMDELKRHMKAQADRQLLEQHKISDENTRREMEAGSRKSESDFEYEETTVVEESVIDESVDE